MKAKKISIRYVPLDSLKENPENARVHGSETYIVENSIDRFGFVNPIKVTKDMMIISGHGRLKAARDAGLTEVPVVVLPFDEEEAKAFALVDNASSDASTWNLEKREEQIAELEGLGWEMGDYGFALPEFEDWTDAGDEAADGQTGDISAPPAETRATFNVMVFCKDKEEQDKVLAYIIKNNIAGQICR